jgi:hypothetical protein
MELPRGGIEARLEALPQPCSNCLEEFTHAEASAPEGLLNPWNGSKIDLFR